MLIFGLVQYGRALTNRASLACKKTGLPPASAPPNSLQAFDRHCSAALTSLPWRPNPRSAAMQKLIAIAFLIAASSPCFGGDVDVKIKTWKLPSDTHYPHDPMVSHDGYIWYTGNKSNNIGRFDPRTGLFKEWTTDIPNS